MKWSMCKYVDRFVTRLLCNRTYLSIWLCVCVCASIRIEFTLIKIDLPLKWEFVMHSLEWMCFFQLKTEATALFAQIEYSTLQIISNFTSSCWIGGLTTLPAFIEWLNMLFLVIKREWILRKQSQNSTGQS